MRVQFFKLEKPVLVAGRQTWQPIRDVWLKLSPVRGRLRVRLGVQTLNATHKARLRYCADLEPGMRFRKGSQILMIHQVDNQDQRFKWQSCFCEEHPVVSPEQKEENP
jgi:SPP1 family predicted phage head-tail adaptor